MTRKTIPLEEFIDMFDDDDPWAVGRNTWNNRISAALGLPEGMVVLLDRDFRDAEREGDGHLGAIIRRIDAKVATKAAAREPVPPPIPFSRKLGHAIRFRRVMIGLSARQVGHVAGISPPVMSRIERGTRNVSVEEFDNLASALGSTPAALLERARSITF